MPYQRLISILSILYFSAIFLYGSDIDSIGIKKEEGEIYVLHQVDAKETLYGLSNRYGASIDAIVANNQITGNSLSVGSVLKIPWKYGITHTVKSGETLYSISKLYQVSTAEIQEENNLNDNRLEVGMILKILSGKVEPKHIVNNELPPSVHIVGTRETLYAISKKYGVDLERLKEWNNLQNSDVQIGDTLYLSAPTTTSTFALPEEESEANAVIAPIEISNTASNEEIIVNRPNNNYLAPVKENGIAAVIDGSSDTKKYLALHRTAPVGTIMRVRNEMTNLSVFVRVVGKLPEIGSNNNVLLRLSPSAQEALGALDGKFRVEISYVPNQ